MTPGDYPATVARLRRDTPGPAEQVATVYAGYEELKNRAELLDFDDLLLHTAAALEEHRGVAEEFRGPLPLLRRRRVPGRHARSSSACSTPGSAAATT